MLDLIKRKNSRGKFYEDSNNLLKQESKDGEPFIDEATGQTIIQKQQEERKEKMRAFDTSRLDAGVGGDED
jgi:hypothetical protein